MSEQEFFIDDRCIIPEWIQNLSEEEETKLIHRLESEARAKKEEILRRRAKA